MTRARTVSVALLVALGCLAPSVTRLDAREKRPVAPSAAAQAMLEEQGFAVEDGQTSRLSSAYRWPTGPVFVTADSGLAAYLLCLRKLLIHRAGRWADEIRPLLAEWTQALERGAPGAEREAGRLFVALLRRVQGDADADTGLSVEQVEALDLELERLRAGDPLARVPGLGTPLDRGPVASLWVHGWLGGPERWQVLVYLLTRGTCDRALRVRLQGTMPRRIEHLLRAYVDGVGVARLGYPGERGVFDFGLRAGTRFPPGVLREQSDLVGLDLGARIGIPWAAAEIARREVARAIRPVAAEPPEDSLRARFLQVLRELPDKPEGAPQMFRSEPWQRLELQTVMGAHVLWRRAVGVASSAAKVFGAGDSPGFVHPDPDFWRALSVLARRTADDAKRDGVRVWVPPATELAALEALVRRRIAEETPFTAREQARLRACGFGGGWQGWFERWCGPRYHEDASFREYCRRSLEEELLGERYGLPALRRMRGDRPPPICMNRLRRLATACEDLAVLAVHQLRGQSAPKSADVLRDWGFLLEDLDGSFHDDPATTCVRGLIDGDRALFQGVAGMDRLWVLYPWGGEAVLCRGSVFGYRELVSKFFVHEGDWRRRVPGPEPPPRPAWAAGFVAR